MLLDYPAWLRIDHWLNVLFLTLLLRSGVEILSTHPKLYWHADSAPGTEWARFTRKVMPTDKLYDTLDEEEDYSPLIALPGHKALGMGRHWHFAAVIGWILLGTSYYILLFVTGQWHRYWPYSWSIFAEAWNDKGVLVQSIVNGGGEAILARLEPMLARPPNREIVGRHALHRRIGAPAVVDVGFATNDSRVP